MRKIILILLISLLMTGCFGETGSGIITKTCTKTIDEDNISITQERVIKNENNKNAITIIPSTITIFLPIPIFQLLSLLFNFTLFPFWSERR